MLNFQHLTPAVGTYLLPESGGQPASNLAIAVLPLHLGPTIQTFTILSSPELGLSAGMGNTSSMLTQYDIEEVQQHCKGIFSQREIISLYERFCALDRTGKGFILEDEFMAVPEFALNPLAQRLLRMLEGVNFTDFVSLLSAFSPRADLRHKLEFIFKVYDSDGDGKVTAADIVEVLRDLSGTFLTEEQRERIVRQALHQAGYEPDCSLTYEDFSRVLSNANLKMEVEIPVD